MPNAIGIDIGGTKIASGLLDLQTGSVLARQAQPTSANRPAEQILNDVLAIAETYGARAQSIGLGLPELVGPTGEILSESTLKWRELPVRECLEQILPTTIEADVRAAARAEAKWGAGAGLNPFLFVTIGTGISCCLVINGQPYLGARGLTGTFASAATVEGPPLENIASGPAIAKQFEKETGTAADAPKILVLARSGNAGAKRIVENSAQPLAAAIAQLINTLDPQAVILGGGLGSVDGLFHDMVKQTVPKFLWSELHRTVPILRAKLGADAGWIGAALASAHR